MDSPILLASQRFTVGIAPKLGGTLLWFGTTGEAATEFVRPTPVRALAEHNARATAGYPLVPYSNRIGDGRFRFEGVDYHLERNTSIPLHPIHGLGCIRPWNLRNLKTVRTAEGATTSRAMLAFTHVSRGESDRAWPWSFEAIQNYELDDEKLRWSLSITNRDTRSMPAGIGMHPFFPKSPRMAIQFGAKSVWRNDDRMLPLGRTPVPAEWNFSDARSVADLDVDNCFGGWSGSARLVWPERGWALALVADHVFGHLVVFTSPARDSIAVEPVSHANNALNLVDRYSDTGLVVLAPGETLAGAFTMTPTALESNG